MVALGSARRLPELNSFMLAVEAALRTLAPPVRVVRASVAMEVSEPQLPQHRGCQIAAVAEAAVGIHILH
jgi:hypothetical protein